MEITRVENEFVRILHEQGTTSIAAGDLPDDIRELLAYGDPLNITAMNQSDAALEAPSSAGMPLPSPAPPTPAPAPEKKKVVVKDLDPPAGPPRIETPTNTGEFRRPFFRRHLGAPAHSLAPHVTFFQHHEYIRIAYRGRAHS